MSKSLIKQIQKTIELSKNIELFEQNLFVPSQEQNTSRGGTPHFDKEKPILLNLKGCAVFEVKPEFGIVWGSTSLGRLEIWGKI